MESSKTVALPRNAEGWEALETEEEMKAKKKAMISQPMAGRTDAEIVARARELGGAE